MQNGQLDTLSDYAIARWSFLHQRFSSMHSATPKNTTSPQICIPASLGSSVLFCSTRHNYKFLLFVPTRIRPFESGQKRLVPYQGATAIPTININTAAVITGCNASWIHPFDRRPSIPTRLLRQTQQLFLQKTLVQRSFSSLSISMLVPPGSTTPIHFRCPMREQLSLSKPMQLRPNQQERSSWTWILYLAFHLG